MTASIHGCNQWERLHPYSTTIEQLIIMEGRDSIMRINGARQFRGNDGKSYLVQDAHKSDMHKGKYILAFKVNDVYKLCYDMFYKLLYFDTIKDAQREVPYSADFIRVM